MIAPCPAQLQDFCGARTGILGRSRLPVTLILDASHGVPGRLHGTVPLKTAQGPRDLAPQSGCACGTLTGVPFVTLPATLVQCAPQADARPTATGVPRRRGTLLLQPAQPRRGLGPAVGHLRRTLESVPGRGFPPLTLFHGAYKSIPRRGFAPLTPFFDQPVRELGPAVGYLRGTLESVQGRGFPPLAPFPGAAESIPRRGFAPLTLFFGTARGRRLEVGGENPHFVCRCHSLPPRTMLLFGLMLGFLG